MAALDWRGFAVVCSGGSIPPQVQVTGCLHLLGQSFDVACPLIHDVRAEGVDLLRKGQPVLRGEGDLGVDPVAARADQFQDVLLAPRVVAHHDFLVVEVVVDAIRTHCCQVSGVVRGGHHHFVRAMAESACEA